MNNKLKEYLQNVSDVLAQEKKASEVFTNKGDAGSTREDIFKSFLQNHLPPRCKVIKGGYIIDANGRESKQIDLMVLNDLTIQFNHFVEKSQKAFATIEGCLAAISVKSFLDKNNLEDSLNGFDSIPQPPDVKLRGVVGGDLPRNLPFRVIFAFDGLENTTLLEHLKNYFASNPVPVDKRVHFIIINNKSMIFRTGDNTAKREDGSTIPPNTYYGLSKRKYIGAYSLLFFINELQNASHLSSMQVLNFDHYVNSLIEELKES